MRFSIILITLILLLSGCGGSDSPPATTPEGLRQVRLALNWFPDPQHGGFFAAQVEGYYEEEGLQVEILSGGPDAPVVPRVALGRVDFGVVSADRLVFGRAEDARVVALMAPIQTSPRCVMVHEESGIETLEDLAKLRRLAMSPAPAFSHHLRQYLDLSGVEIVPYSGSVANFLLDKQMGQQAFIFSEPVVARERGATPRGILVSESGYNPYGSVLITRDSQIENDPELLAAMTRATLRGGEAYRENPERANALILERNPEMSESVLREGAASLAPLLSPVETEKFGGMTHERWETLTRQIESLGLVPSGKVKVEELYTTQFLP